MSDPISWGLLASIKKLVKSVKTSVDNIDLSPVTGAVEDIATDLGQDMDELVANVGAEVDEMKEAVENAPAGPFPFVMNKFQVNSVDEGIKITYKANNSASITSGNDKENAVGSIEPRGVMIRYSDDHYPATPTDGLLAVDDTDIVDDASATGNTKEKTYTLPGLTNNQLYYFSAFPYSYSGVFNTNCGFSGDTSRHRKTCSYTGNKGTLTVDVTQDYDYETLGEFTVTLTPSSGNAKTQTRTGPGQVVFAGLDAGAYTLSFETKQRFTTPTSQQIVITAGQPNTASAEYKASKTLNDYSWSTINQIAQDGLFSTFFKVGDVKTESTTLYGNVEMQVVGTNHDLLSATTSANKAKISFMSKNVVFQKKMNEINSSDCSYGYITSDLKSYLDSTVYNSLSEDLRQNIKTVYKYICKGPTGFCGGDWVPLKLWIPRVQEVTDVNSNVVIDEKGNGAKLYSYFSTTTKRRKQYNSENCSYWTSSRYVSSGTGRYHIIDEEGYRGETNMNYTPMGVSFGFCI